MNYVIIDYDIGNVKSILNAFKEFSVNIKLSRDKNEIINADGLILPGVGAFSQGMYNLKKYNLIEIIHKYVSTNKPLLGICLGMQLLFDESEEFGKNKGLGLIEGKVLKLPVKKNIKLPHISWNEIIKLEINWNDTILNKINKNTDMYFVHTFAGFPSKKFEILSITNYFGVEFCSSVKKNNIYGCQFHPEKSSSNGLKIIRNFIQICRKFKT